MRFHSSLLVVVGAALAFFPSSVANDSGSEPGRSSGDSSHSSSEFPGSSSGSHRPPPPFSQTCLDAQTKFWTDSLSCTSNIRSLASLTFGNISSVQLDSLCGVSGCLANLKTDLQTVGSACNSKFMNESISDNAWIINNAYQTFCKKDQSQQYCLVTLENSINTISTNFESWISSGSVPQTFLNSFCQPCVGNMFLTQDGNFQNHDDNQKPKVVSPSSSSSPWLSGILRNPRNVYNFLCSSDPIEGSCANDLVALIAEDRSRNFTSDIVCSRCNSRVEGLIDREIGNSKLCSQSGCFESARKSIDKIVSECKSSVLSGSCSDSCSSALSNAFSKAGCCLYPFLNDEIAQVLMKTCPSFSSAASAVKPCSKPVYNKPTKVFIELNFTNIVVSYAQVNLHALEAAIKNDTIRLFGCRVDDIDVNWKGLSVGGGQVNISTVVVEIVVEAHDPITSASLLSSVTSILNSLGFSFQSLSTSISSSAALKDPTAPAAAYTLNSQGLVQPSTPTSGATASTVFVPLLFTSFFLALSLLF